MQRKKFVFFLHFLAKVYARAEVKHTIYFERPKWFMLVAKMETNEQW